MDAGGIADVDMAATGKVEPLQDDGTPSSLESTPERDVHADASQEAIAQPQKRKGGRKPIYATSEERKQRNRQAQAAFRERRTEYIKQLEATIKQNEETLGSLQQSHRSAADECLMLRYKNSLLERILLEKGIDVQAELQIKTGSPVLAPGFVHPAPNMPQAQASQPPLQRAAIQRQHARRSGGQAFLPKLAPGQANPEMGFPNCSPQGQPTPSSHASSPTSVPMRSPMVAHQGGMTPPISASFAQGQAQQYPTYPRSSQPPPNSNYYQVSQQQRPPKQRPPPPSTYQSSASIVSSHSNTSQHSLNPQPPMPTGAGGVNPNPGLSSAATYYPSPFQKHIDQLEHEYDTQHSQSMLDQQDYEVEHRSNTSPHQLQGAYQSQYAQQADGSEYYRQAFAGQPAQQQLAPHPHYDQPQMMSTSQAESAANTNGAFATGQSIDPNDPLLDADPFGLSASMHFPTSYSTMDQQPSRR